MNLRSEQIRPDLSLDIALDQTLTRTQQQQTLISFLGIDHCSIENICGRTVLVYKEGEKQIVLLHKAISYLGGNGQHPIYKKRVQISPWFKQFYYDVKQQGLPYDIRIIGVYHYQGAIIFADFIKDTYFKKKANSSSAHIYINDLFQALKYGVFHKEDMNENHIYAIRGNCLRNYLMGIDTGKNVLFSLFEKFNYGFPFGQWLTVLKAAREMYENKWPNWGQSEWAGWFLEYKFEQFIRDNNITSLMKYTGISNKGNIPGVFDFDIWFDHDNFYGDLKASDILQKEAIGNDISNFEECINMYDKFWYVIYEHETEKDSEQNGYKDVISYNRFLRNTGKQFKDKDELSYKTKLKTKVRFAKMTILELNRINYRDALTIFNQGHQPDGAPRNPKFSIKKKDMDRYSVFRYTYTEK